MSLEPTFSGEVQFRRYSDTSTQGASIVLALADRDELSLFIGKEGKRFMAVLVEVGDDEKPVEPQKKPLGTIAQWLVLRCQEREFWAFLNSEQAKFIDSEPDAKQAVCEMLKVDSRKDVDGNEQAMGRFHALIRGPYSRWLLRRGVTA